MSDLADSIINFFMSKFLILRYIMFTLRSRNFSQRRTKSSFNKLAFRSIHRTNREPRAEMPGGISGFSTSERTVQKWTLTSYCVDQCVAILRNDLRCSKTNWKPKDLGKSRIEFSNKSADRAYDVLKQGRNPFDERFANQHLFGKRGYTSNT